MFVKETRERQQRQARRQAQQAKANKVLADHPDTTRIFYLAVHLCPTRKVAHDVLARFCFACPALAAHKNGLVAARACPESGHFLTTQHSWESPKKTLQKVKIPFKARWDRSATA